MNYKTLKLPESLRETLKKPFGELLSDLEELKRNKNIICVGDETSRISLNLGLKPKILVYDGRIKREFTPIPSIIRDFNAKEVRVDNPAGYITKESFEAIYSALRDIKRVKIRIDGEEDLLTIAAIELAPEGSMVLYGQPDQGLVVAKVTKENKEKVRRILNQMEESKQPLPKNPTFLS